jgi:hypothetical protein
MTSKEKAPADSAPFEAEIKLAERGVHVLMERVAMGRMPKDALPTGDVSSFLDAVGEHLEVERLREKGKKVATRRVKKAARNLISAIDPLTSWPEEPRLEVASVLVAMLRTVELDSVAENLLVALQQAEVSVVDEVEEPEAVPESVPEPSPEPSPEPILEPARIRGIIEKGEWIPELEGLLRLLREETRVEPDDDLLNLLKGGVVFNAVTGRRKLLLDERRRMAEAEPLPEDLAAALADLPDDLVDSELVRFGLHLVLADVVAAGLLPEKSPPEVTVAAALVAIRSADEPRKKPDIDPLGAWAKTMPLKIDVLSDDIAPVFEWKPPQYEDSLERRHEERWKVESLMFQFLPARWVPGRDEELPPYTTEKARERFDELRDIAWLMVDEIEPVRFVSEAFRYGDGAPDAVDLEIVRDIIALWKDQSLVSAVEDFGHAYLEDEWKHEIPEDESDQTTELLPAAVTADGEPLLLSTVVFGIVEGAREEIVKRLDAAEGFRREGGAGDCWSWFGPSKGSTKAVADLTLGENHLTVQTQSLAWASKANSRLVEELGEQLVLEDISTREATPEMLAELGIVPGEEEAEAPSEDQKQVIHQVLDKHYRTWLDEAAPALGDLSPREAAADPEQRPEVVAQLLEAEERTRASSWPMNEFDFDFLWDELGLSRDEAS